MSTFSDKCRAQGGVVADHPELKDRTCEDIDSAAFCAGRSLAYAVDAGSCVAPVSGTFASLCASQAGVLTVDTRTGIQQCSHVSAAANCAMDPAYAYSYASDACQTKQ